MINDVRKKKLKLRPVTYLSGSQGSDSDIPHGYIWSPHLVPKPKGIRFAFQLYVAFQHHQLTIFSYSWSTMLFGRCALGKMF